MTGTWNNFGVRSITQTFKANRRKIWTRNHIINTHTHTHIYTAVHTLSALYLHLYMHACHKCRRWLKCIESNTPKYDCNHLCELKTKHARRLRFPTRPCLPPEKHSRVECFIYSFFALHWCDLRARPAHVCTSWNGPWEHATLLSSEWVFVWFQYRCWPADRLRINHTDSACSATQRSSNTSDKNKRWTDRQT